jgi:hypothetical protein
MSAKKMKKCFVGKISKLCGEMAIKIRVARWHIFEPKIPIWVYFGGP